MRLALGLVLATLAPRCAAEEGAVRKQRPAWQARFSTYSIASVARCSSASDRVLVGAFSSDV